MTTRSSPRRPCLSPSAPAAKTKTYWLSTSGKHTKHHLHPALPAHPSTSQVPTRHPQKNMAASAIRDTSWCYTLNSQEATWTQHVADDVSLKPPSRQCSNLAGDSDRTSFRVVLLWDLMMPWLYFTLIPHQHTSVWPAAFPKVTPGAWQRTSTPADGLAAQ